MADPNLRYMRPITTTDTGLDLYHIGFTRVTELMPHPSDSWDAAQSFIEEVKTDWRDLLNYDVTVIETTPVFPGEEKRDEIEYQFLVLMNVGDAAYLVAAEAPYTITPARYTR